MNSSEVIESYVTDVAVQLPRRQRNDVAFELRALLNEELQAKAQAAGVTADANMAIELLRAFGAPGDVAARYRSAVTVIDPADGQSFLRATVIGLAIIWCAGLLERLQQPIASGSDIVNALAQWWTGTVITSLWWPGLLVVSFAVAAWARRRWPQTSHWKPRAVERIPGSRATMVLAIVGIACGLFALANPTWLLDMTFGGRAAPAAYAALTYTDTFLHRQAPCLFVLILLNIPLLAAVIVSGRWSPGLRRLEALLAIITSIVLVWTVLDGPVFSTSSSDHMFKVLVGLSVAFTLSKIAFKWYRSVKPTPQSQAWQ